MFQEWWCDEATLHLLEPDGTQRKLADYRAVPLSLMPRSTPADGEYELVAIDGGDQPGQCRDVETGSKRRVDIAIAPPGKATDVVTQ
jgi:hypothetical protein